MPPCATPARLGQHAGETKIQQGGNTMKLISYVHGGSKGWGVVVEPDAAGGGIIPADQALMAKYPTIRGVLAAGALAEVAVVGEGQEGVGQARRDPLSAAAP